MSLIIHPAHRWRRATGAQCHACGLIVSPHHHATGSAPWEWRRRRAQHERTTGHKMHPVHVYLEAPK
jgi:hypothetical protein